MTYGEEAAVKTVEQFEEIVDAALAGSREALLALVSVAAQNSYTDGFAAASTTAGFPL